MRLPFLIEKKLHERLGTFHSIVYLDVKDIHGKIVKSKKMVGHSLTGNFLQFLYTNFSEENVTDYLVSSFNGGSNTNTKSTGGPAGSTYQAYMQCHALTNDASYGIVLGTGVVAPTAFDYILGVQILNGTGVGQLSHLPQGSSQAPAAVGNTTSFVLQRLYQNNSGATISPTELGIYIKSPTTGQAILMFRETFAAVAILATQSLTAKVTFEVTT